MITMTAFEQQLKTKIDTKTKPLGALGRLESLAFQVAKIQNSLSPSLNKPTLFVFAADHGAAQHGISAFPPEVTAQMVLNFLSGGAAINVFCRQHHIDLHIVDAGVDYDFPADSSLIDYKVAAGTANYLETQAITPTQLKQCFSQASALVDSTESQGCNVIGFGEMGIGNTSSASLIMHKLYQVPLAECVGRGTGVDDQQLAQKLELLQQAANLHANQTDPESILLSVGGFEIAHMVGAMLQAKAKGMLILVDGFIATAAMMLAHAIDAKVLDNAVFCHQSDEGGHAKMLELLGVEALLKFQMRLGEGSGCAVAYPLVQSAVNFLNDMASFESAGVSDKS